jgi:hypothetical protein
MYNTPKNISSVFGCTLTGDLPDAKTFFKTETNGNHAHQNLPWSNSSMNGNIRAQQSTKVLLPKPSQNLPCVVSYCPNQAFQIRCSPSIGSSWCRALDEGQHSAFLCVWCSRCMVVTPSFTHLSITFSDHCRFGNCSLTLHGRDTIVHAYEHHFQWSSQVWQLQPKPLMLDPWRLRGGHFWGNCVLEMNILCCWSSVISRNNSSQCLTTISS